jgi:hypothetical protein
MCGANITNTEEDRQTVHPMDEETISRCEKSLLEGVWMIRRLSGQWITLEEYTAAVNATLKSLESQGVIQITPCREPRP